MGHLETIHSRWKRQSKSMRFALLLSVSTLLFVFGIITPVSAHVFKSDGSITAEMHINPNDKPVSKTPTEYLLWFTDTSGKFALTNCDCYATFTTNNAVTARQQLSPNGPNGSLNSVIFPQAGIYTLQVSRAPNNSGTFQPFNLTYTIRVEAGVSDVSQQNFPVPVAVGLGAMVVLVLLGAFAFNYTSRKGNKNRDENV